MLPCALSDVSVCELYIRTQHPLPSSPRYPRSSYVCVCYVVVLPLRLIAPSLYKGVGSKYPHTKTSKYCLARLARHITASDRGVCISVGRADTYVMP